MDELEFRRRLLADPGNIDDELAVAMQAPNNKVLAEELQALDKQLNKALHDIQVPDGLVDRILFHQSGHAEKKSPKQRQHFALAASVAFAFGLMLGQFNWGSAISPVQATSLEQVALTHMLEEQSFISNIDENVTLTQVNAKLAPFDSQFSAIDDHISYVNHCGFGDTAAMHMIMQTEYGEVTVFLVPQPSQNVSRFEDEQHKGMLVPLENNSLIVIGDKKLSISPIVTKIKNNLLQQI
ncbi:DUF3379 family protein [Thaumasiovibrio sp. DFM-14]|uniref:DUF3379 family protein n=1 Tax=Thaumasiovibrio sp. DFM-14 TaxID=3384792 RepID=UPI0039A19BBF